MVLDVVKRAFIRQLPYKVKERKPGADLVLCIASLL